MQETAGKTMPGSVVGKSLYDTRILLLDENRLHLQALLDLTRKAGYRNIHGFSDAYQAVDAYRVGGADLVLMDVDLSDLDGVQVMAELQALTQTDDYLALIALTAQSDRETRLKVLSAGARDCVSKPFDDEELLHRIHNVLEARLLHSRLSEQLRLKRETEARLRDSEERFKLATKAADEGVWDWNIRTGSVFMSSRWKALLGYREDQLPDTLEAWTSRVHPEDLSQAMADLEAYMDGKLSTYDKTIRVRHRDGAYRWIKNRWMAVRDETGMAARIVGTADDITEDVTLRDELEQARARAETANRAKSEFLANMSHEIRTPLTAIIGFAEASIDDHEAQLDHFGALQAIIDNGQHLRALIDDILDLSKIEADRLEMETVSVGLMNLVMSCNAAIRPQADAKRLAFETHFMPPLPRTIQTDPTRLKQILYNLCNNAVKFTEQGSVRVIVSCEQEAQRLVFTVCDQGIGMSGDQMARVFEPFVQADTSTTRQFGGTGLGLSISRRLAKRLGGDIEVVSEPDLGSIFVLTLDTGPLPDEVMTNDPQSEPVSVCHTAHSSQIPQVRGNILLAEDNPYNQKLVSLYARKTGAEIAIVENGEQAVEAALAGNYQLILMDLQMPVMGGIEATELLRQTMYQGPIAALTAHSMIGDRDKVLQAGCTDFLTKPVDWSALFQLIAKYLPAADPHHRSTDDDNDNDDEQLRLLVARFVADLPETVQRLERACARGDWDRVRSLAHQLKGVAGGLGYPQLTELGAAMERAAQLPQPEAGVEALLETLKQECSRLVPASELQTYSAERQERTHA